MTSIRIGTVAAPLRVGSAVQLTSSIVADGCTSAQLVTSWGSGDATIVAVSASGMATAVGPGRATVRASHSSGASDAIEIVVDAPVARVDVTPTRDTLVQGASLQLSATPRDADGFALSDRLVTWSTSDPVAATVSSTGLVSALAQGTEVTVTATSEGRSGSAQIALVPPPRLQLSSTSAQFVATVGAADPAADQVTITNGGGGRLGNLVAGPVSYGPGAGGWLSISLSAQSATPSAMLALQPRIAGLSAGGYRADVPVSANASNAPLTITVTLTVRSVPVGSVEVSPQTTLLAVGAKQTLTATVRDASGAVLLGRTVRWQSTNPGVAAVDPSTGLVTAASTGVASMLATADGISGVGFVYTGSSSPFDGTWRGSAGAGRTFAMTIQLGRVTSLSIGVGTPSGSPCPLSYSASPLSLVSSNAFSFATSGGTSNAAVTGALLSSRSAQGTYGTITFDRYLCPPNRIVTGTVPGGTWTAARQ